MQGASVSRQPCWHSAVWAYENHIWQLAFTKATTQQAEQLYVGQECEQSIAACACGRSLQTASHNNNRHPCMLQSAYHVAAGMVLWPYRGWLWPRQHMVVLVSWQQLHAPLCSACSILTTGLFAQHAVQQPAEVIASGCSIRLHDGTLFCCAARLAGPLADQQSVTHKGPVLMFADPAGSVPQRRVPATYAGKATTPPPAPTVSRSKRSLIASSMQPSDAETIEQLQEEVREGSCLLVVRACMQCTSAAT